MADGSTTPRIKLYDWPVSPFCRKVRAVLDHKGLAYELVPALAHRRDLVRRGKTGKVPAVDVDGTLVVDSTEIVHVLESRFPQAPVLPADPERRALCHVLEEWCDESLYFFGLYFHWHEPAGRKNVARYFNRTLRGRIAYPPLLLRIERQLWGQGMTRKSPEHVARDLARNLDSVEVLTQKGPYLLGDGPFLCDFALAAQLAYLTRTPSQREALASRPHTRAFLDRVKVSREPSAVSP